jgi:hypothetical protein
MMPIPLRVRSKVNVSQSPSKQTPHINRIGQWPREEGVLGNNAQASCVGTAMVKFEIWKRSCHQRKNLQICLREENR